MLLGFTDDDAGNHSSKRLCALLLIFSAILIAFVLCGVSIFKVVADAKTIKEVIDAFIWGGIGLGVGGTAAEAIYNFIKKPKGVE